MEDEEENNNQLSKMDEDKEDAPVITPVVPLLTKKNDIIVEEEERDGNSDAENDGATADSIITENVTVVDPPSNNNEILLIMDDQQEETTRAPADTPENNEKEIIHSDHPPKPEAPITANDIVTTPVIRKDTGSAENNTDATATTTTITPGALSADDDDNNNCAAVAVCEDEDEDDNNNKEDENNNNNIKTQGNNNTNDEGEKDNNNNNTISSSLDSTTAAAAAAASTAADTATAASDANNTTTPEEDSTTTTTTNTAAVVVAPQPSETTTATVASTAGTATTELEKEVVEETAQVIATISSTDDTNSSNSCAAEQEIREGEEEDEGNLISDSIINPTAATTTTNEEEGNEEPIINNESEGTNTNEGKDNNTTTTDPAAVANDDDDDHETTTSSAGDIAENDNNSNNTTSTTSSQSAEAAAEAVTVVDPPADNPAEATEEEATNYIVTEQQQQQQQQSGPTTASTANSNTTTTSSSSSSATTATPSSSSSTTTAKPSSLISLPMDSLHSIASFLTPSEWNEFGKASRGTRRVCREIIRRVRMHGFRCASEVITAWKLGQHADARELAALYIQAGVPIYPRSLGHSYHTLIWKMNVEIKETEEKERQVEGENVADGTVLESEESPASSTDPFFRERQEFRGRENYGDQITYVAEKSLFWMDKKASNTAATAASDTPLRSFRPNRSPSPVAEVVGSTGGDASRSSSVTTASMSSPSFTPKLAIKVHQHLLHQHNLGRDFVNDHDGAMMTPPVSLSVDFFHPNARQFASNKRTAPSAPSSISRPDIVLREVENEGGEAGEVAAPVPVFRLADEPPLLPQDPADDDAADAAAINQDPEEVARALPDFPAEEQDPDLDVDNHDTLFEPANPLPQAKVNAILNNVELEVYCSSFSGDGAKTDSADTHEMKRHLRSRFTTFQRRLEAFLAHSDHSGFDECILDFWDEFFPHTNGIQYYDRHTPVPRISFLQKFLTKPCPKAIGIVQCEIERLKITTRGKGVNVKGRLFPQYEYRLFIRHRPVNADGTAASEDDPPLVRRDTVMVVAKNRGRKHVQASGVVPASVSSKKGSNNYYLHLPQQADVDDHFNKANETKKPVKMNPNGASIEPVLTSDQSGSALLGRLQSNFIGTEFQIFTPHLQKRPRRKPVEGHSGSYSPSEDDLDYDSGMSSDNTTSRRSRFGRLSLRRSSHNAEPSSDGGGPIMHTSRGLHMTHALSSPDLPTSRHTRTSRRAIAANTSETQQQQQQQPRQTQLSEPSLYEAEDGAITYTANLLGSRPRIMDVCIPKVTPDGAAGADWKRYLENCDDTDECGMLNCFRQLQQRLSEEQQNAPTEELNRDNESETAADNDEEAAGTDFGLMALQNRPPWWNIELGSFVLNFGGRVSVASVKNFQLCDRNDHEQIMLQFGRIQGRHSFTMDFQHPLTAVQAFSIAISSLQSKISFG